MEIDIIKKKLIKACETGDVSLFKPYLYSDKVIVGFKNKDDFYRYFEYRVESEHCCKGDNLELRISKYSEDYESEYGFYDKVHLKSRLSILVNETSNYIEIDIMPF